MDEVERGCFRDEDRSAPSTVKRGRVSSTRRKIRRGKDRAHPSPFKDLAGETLKHSVHSSLEREVPALQLRLVVDLAAEETRERRGTTKEERAVSVRTRLLRI